MHGTVLQSNVHSWVCSGIELKQPKTLGSEGGGLVIDSNLLFFSFYLEQGHLKCLACKGLY